MGKVFIWGMAGLIFIGLVSLAIIMWSSIYRIIEVLFGWDKRRKY